MIMIAGGDKTSWSKEYLQARPGAKKGCSGCGKQFRKTERFMVKEVKVNWFRGDDEVSFLCYECTPEPIRKIYFKIVVQDTE